MIRGLRFPFFYGWVILASAFVLLGLAYTVWYSFSVFFVAILEEFGWSRALTAGVFSVFMLVHGFTGSISGVLVDRKGPRWVVGVGTLILVFGLLGASRVSAPWHLYLFFGVVAAVGVNATGWVPNITLLQNWFARRTGTVIGIASAGTGFGILLLVPLTQYLITWFGWRNAFLIQAAIVFAIMLPTTLLFQRRRPQDMGLLPDGVGATAEQRRVDQERLVVDREWANRAWTLRDALCTHRFWFSCFSALLLSFAAQMALAHQVVLLVDAGYEKMLAASTVGVVGIASVVGKLTWGAASDRVGREVAFSIGMACAAMGIVLLALAGTAHFVWLPYLYGVWMGLGYSVSAPLTPTLAADLFRGKSFGAIFGAMVAGGSVGGAIGAWLAGYVFDVTGSYLIALALALVAILAAIASLWLAAPRKVRLVPGQAMRLTRTGHLAAD